MIRNPKVLLLAAATITLASLLVWLATERHFYTKFQVVEEVTVPVEADDPLAATGFYDDEIRHETVRRDAFHFGLLPTPPGLFDKHALSVMSFSGPAWAFALALIWLRSRRSRRREALATN